jgi:hypothetical protein
MTYAVGDKDDMPEYDGPACFVWCVPVGVCTLPHGHEGQHVAGDGYTIVGVKS